MEFVKILVLVLFLMLTSFSSIANTRYGMDNDEAKAVIEQAERITQLRIPMRDGIFLNADILFPKIPKKKPNPQF